MENLQLYSQLREVMLSTLDFGLSLMICAIFLTFLFSFLISFYDRKNRRSDTDLIPWMVLPVFIVGVLIYFSLNELYTSYVIYSRMTELLTNISV